MLICVHTSYVLNTPYTSAQKYIIFLKKHYKYAYVNLCTKVHIFLRIPHKKLKK